VVDRKITVKLSPADVVALDQLRGPLGRSSFLRSLLKGGRPAGR
jgi:hypothetical protein